MFRSTARSMGFRMCIGFLSGLAAGIGLVLATDHPVWLPFAIAAGLVVAGFTRNRPV